MIDPITRRAALTAVADLGPLASDPLQCNVRVMRNNVLVVVLIASAASFTGALAACSSSTSEGSQAGDSGPAETSTSADGGKDTSTAADTSTSADPDKACAALDTQQECGTCCIQNHQTGYKLFQDTLLACACAGTGADGGAPCATECAATICKSPPAQADMTCSTCLQATINEGGECQESVATACMASEDCLAEQKCIVPCTKKP